MNLSLLDLSTTACLITSCATLQAHRRMANSNARMAWRKTQQHT